MSYDFNRFRLWRNGLLAAALLGASTLPTHAQELSAQAQSQIASLLAEKEARTPAQQKLDSRLIYGAKMQKGEAITSAVETLNVGLSEDAGGLVLVDIDAAVTHALVKQIRAAGGVVENSFPEYNALRVRLPLAQVEAIAASSDVRFIRPAVQASLEDVPQAVTEDAVRPRANSNRHAQQQQTPRSMGLRARVSGILARVQRPAATQLDDLLLPGTLSSLTILTQFDATPLRGFTLLAFAPGAITNTGSVNSEGDTTHRAAQARTTFGVTGAGIKVGVLSDSIDNTSGSYAAAVTSGDVSPVTVLSGQAGSGAGEGLAMLEIVHDLAPDAQLYFATAFNGVASFAANIRALRAAGCDIIIDDVGYFNESPFQDGPIAQAVNDVTASGALYFSSAANSGSFDKGSAGTWEGDFVDGGAAAAPITDPNGKGYRLLQFAPGQNYNAFPSTTPTAGGTRYADLFWADPLGASTNDYDMFYLDATGTTVLGSSTTTQNGTQDPYEAIDIDATGAPFVNKRLVVVKAGSAAARYIHFDTQRGYQITTTPGNTRGHSAAVAAFSMAATPAAASGGAGRGTPAPNGPYPGAFTTANKIEGFSSDGPRRVFFNADGTPITPGNFLAATGGGTVRLKPDITAADGVVTTLPAASGLNPFYGTSAAAPHAGAIAALLKSYAPSQPLSQYRTSLTTGVIDIEAAGYDRDSGYGIVDAVSVLASVPSAVASVSVNPTTVSGGQSATGTVTLRDPAPAGGAVVTLSATAPASVPATVTVPAGSKTATFPVTTAVVTTTQTSTIQASYAGSTQLTSLVVTAQYAISGRVVTTSGVGVSGVTVTTLVPGVAGLPSQTNTPNPPTAIPDGGNLQGTAPGASVLIPITFTGSGTVGSIKVGVNITHTFRGDLLIALFAPDGTYVILKNPSNDGTANFITSFPDQTPSDEPVSNLYGKPVAGTWQLYVQDYYSGDTGTVNSFTLTLGQNVQVPSTVTTNGTGNYTFPNFAPGTYPLTPTKTGFNFVPVSRTVTVGPNATGQDFTLSQAGIRSSATAVKGTDYAVTITLANGGPDATNAQITKALIGTTSPTSPALPTNLGTITLGNSVSVTLHYPLSIGASGTTAALRLSGTVTGSSFGGTIPVALP